MSLQSKLDQALVDENYYEAHQMYLTMSKRLLRVKKFQECHKLLFEGASTLLKMGQQASGVDLLKHMLSKESMNKETRKEIEQVIEYMDFEDSSVLSFVRSIDDFLLNDIFGLKVSQELSIEFLLKGTENSLDKISAQLFQESLSMNGFLLFQVILRLLIQQKIDFAQKLFDLHTALVLERHPSEKIGIVDGVIIFKTEYFNYARFMIITACKANDTLFKILTTKIKVNEETANLIERVRTTYIRPSAGLGNLLQMFAQSK